MSFHSPRWHIVRTLPTGQMEVVLSNIDSRMAGAIARLMERTTETPGATYEAVLGTRKERA